MAYGVSDGAVIEVGLSAVGLGRGGHGGRAAAPVT